MIVKCAIRFPVGTPESVIHGRLTRPTQLQRPDGHYEPYIHCNITSISDDWLRRPIAQVSYEMSDEKKLIREIEIMKGEIIDVRNDLNQRQISETNGSGLKINTELVDEIIKGNYKFK